MYSHSLRGTSLSRRNPIDVDDVARKVFRVFPVFLTTVSIGGGKLSTVRNCMLEKMKLVLETIMEVYLLDLVI